MSKKEILILFVSSIVLFLISCIIILIKGNVYELKVNLYGKTYDINEFEIDIDQTGNNVKLLDKKIADDTLILKFKSINKGVVFIEITGDDFYSGHRLFVHNFGVITYERILGKCSGGLIFPISILIIIFEVFIIKIRHYMRDMKKNMYQYKNIATLGIVIFVGFMFLNQLSMILKIDSYSDYIRGIFTAASDFSMVALPFFTFVSLLVTISNIKLLKKEGFSFRNMLGIFLGIFFIFLSVFPELLYRILHNYPQIDIYNERGIGTYIYTFCELFIYGIVSYLECVLFGTIALAIKAARRIPTFDKDYIIILGCMIRKDGTLTPILKNRADKAIEFSKLQKDATGKEIIFVPSGGQGSDETISEGEAISNYLIECGIKKKNILVEDRAKNTDQNIKFSYELIKKTNKKANIAFSTTNYHVFRTGIIATNQKISVEGIGSKTKAYFWINAFIREFVATLYYEKKKNIKMVFYITLMTLFVVLLMYISTF